ncbi:hypothetical protein ACI2K4_16315 [Micromonospora sp. NPDC050397]|uniref:hypothetical protein n=1 Tax=Micromonospora sp. NPDC050397 TaxID=3364279 RepID=UPI00385076D0
MTARDLESRYRRLLAVYPWEHRRRYEEEMLAVLLEGARPGQRRPGIGDVADLVVTGLRVRLGRTARGLASPTWSDAATVTGLLAALALLTLAGHAVVMELPVEPGSYGYRMYAPLDLVEWLRLAGWGLVCVAVLVGLRWPAAGLAGTAVVAETILLLWRYGAEPVPVVGGLWQLALTVVAAVALGVPAPPRRALAVLGTGRLVRVVLALVVVDTVFLVNRVASAGMGRHPGEAWHGRRFDLLLLEDGLIGRPDLVATSPTVLSLYTAVLAVACLTLLFTIATTDAPVRRRIIVLLAPVVALVVVLESTLGGWAAANVHRGPAIYLVPAQWVALATVPVLTLAIGVLLVRRREQTLRMLALGRDADRERPAD